MKVQQSVSLAGSTAAALALRDHLHQAVMSGDVLADQGNCGVACALRFAPIRSCGFRMPRRERAVELVGGGVAQVSVSSAGLVALPGGWASNSSGDIRAELR
jgi:hypothetical protein